MQTHRAKSHRHCPLRTTSCVTTDTRAAQVESRLSEADLVAKHALMYAPSKDFLPSESRAQVDG
jgi:hypothetical protein